ncbi:hypothetical protein RF11_08482 [Thelohanellus kitauei]|uniref:Uncharacterized protein n=1 Tax=Thelohanellus kitauei TaxID=669202 RepID=A0A0C2J8I6_THEKT|nr:hypothetical protein RF11_08482 [Thelohanellus kitauei]
MEINPKFLCKNTDIERWQSNFDLVAANMTYTRYKLFRSDGLLELDEDGQNLFKRLKSHLKHIPSIGVSDILRKFKFYINASVVAFGPLMTQRLDGLGTPIMFDVYCYPVENSKISPLLLVFAFYFYDNSKHLKYINSMNVHMVDDPAQ